MGKKSESGSGMTNNLDHISESLETIFGGEENSDLGWKKFGSGINIPDPQHCWLVSKQSIKSLKLATLSMKGLTYTVLKICRMYGTIPILTEKIFYAIKVRIVSI
jgi:hypothetical protein